jgi:S1-C subfamily serine protease
VSIASDLQHEILSKKIGQQVELEVWRSGRIVHMGVMTGEQPSPLQRASTRPQKNPPRNIPPTRTVPQPSSPGFSFEDASKDSLKEYGISRQAAGGVVVTKVEEGSAASVAGLEPGDVITEAGGHPVLGHKDLEAVLQSGAPDRGILLLIERGGSRAFAILKP